MGKKMKLSKRISWRVETVLFLMAEFLLSLLSLRSGFLLGEFMGSILYRFNGKYRIIVKRNLRITQSREGFSDPTEDQVEQVFRRSGGNFFTIFSVKKLKRKDLEKHLILEGEEELIEALKEGKGAIVMLPHMGNWEILTKLTEYLPSRPPIGALFRPLNNPLMNEVILKRREMAGMQLISSRNPAFGIIKLLKKNGIMCILSDQKVGNRGTMESFFGVKCLCTRLPYLMHEKAGAPLFTLKMISVEPGVWRVAVKQFKGERFQEAMDQLAVGMQESLADCFLFHDRWQEFPTHQKLSFCDQVSSPVFQHKKLPVLIESREKLEGYPVLAQALERFFQPIYWGEESGGEHCYMAIGEGEDFREQCQKYSLKKSLRTYADAQLIITGNHE